MKKKQGRPKSENRARDFLILKNHLNLSSIAKEMGINRVNLTDFKYGRQKLNKKNQIKLEKILQRYGFRIKRE